MRGGPGQGCGRDPVSESGVRRCVSFWWGLSVDVSTGPPRAEGSLSLSVDGGGSRQCYGRVSSASSKREDF